MSSDYQLEDTLYLPFTTRAFATGVPTALVSGAVDIYEDVTATPIITGETLTVSLNSVAGFNMITVTATAGTGFEAGKSYTAILQAGTVGGTSVVGEVVAHFTLDKSAAAQDLANGTDGLGAIKADTAAVKTKTDFLPSATAGAAGGVFIAGTNAATTVTTSFTSTFTGNLTGSVGSLTTNNDKTGYALSSAGIDAIWDETMAGHVTADTAGLVMNDLQDGGRLDLIIDIIAADVVNIDGIVPAAAGDAMTLTAGGVDLIWDETLAGHVTADTTGLLLNEWQDGGRLDLILDARMAETSISTTGGAVDTVTDVSNSVTVGSIDANAVTATSIQAGAITDAKFATDAITSTVLAASAAAEIADAVYDEDLADHVSVGTAGEAAVLNAYHGPKGPGIYIDDGAANTSTVTGEDGTEKKPVSTMATARTIAGNIGIKRYYFTGTATAMTVSATTEDWHFVGLNDRSANVLDLNSADVDRSLFENLTIYGVQGGAARVTMVDCVLEDDPGAGFTDLHIHAIRCGLASADPGIRLTNNNDHIFDQPYSMVPGNTAPMIDAQSGANIGLSIRHLSGGVELKGLSATSATTVEGMGQVIFNASNTTTAPVTIRGLFTVTDNATMTVVTEDARLDVVQINAEVVDALDTDTYAEPGKATPAATASLSDKLSYLYKAWLNKSDQTSSTYQLYNSAGSVVDQKATVSDDTTTATKGAVVSGT